MSNVPKTCRHGIDNKTYCSVCDAEFEGDAGMLCDDGGPEDLDDGVASGEECGRWRNGRLSRSCSKAGSEECDFECPYR